MIVNLTLGERMTIARRRRGYTQRYVADLLCLPRRAMQELEADTYVGDVADRVKRFADLGGQFHDHERCFVARRRSGESVGAVSKATGVSRQWINEMESGRESCETLMRHWSL